MSTVILLLILFGTKHFICDFVLQFPYMLNDKGRYGAAGGIHHAGIHALGTIVILLLVGLTVIDTMVLSIIDGLAHYHIDWGKQQFIKGLSVVDRMFWVWLGADQGLHYLTYVVIISIIV